MTETKLTMNVWETNVAATVFAVQGEAGSRQLDLTLIEDNGVKGAMSNAEVVNKPLDLTGVTTPRLYVSKQDGTKVICDGKVTDVKNGKASFVLPAQALAVSGRAECQIVLTKSNGETLKIIGLTLDIKPSDLDGAIESGDDYGSLQQMVILVAQTQQQAADWLKDANAQFDALLAADSAELTAWLADAAQQAQAAIHANDTAFGAWFEQLQGKLSGDVAASLQSQVDAINASKGKASGLATLNASGKLAQMPTAADVGAAAASLVPATATTTTANKMTGCTGLSETMTYTQVGKVMHVTYTAANTGGTVKINSAGAIVTLPAASKQRVICTAMLYAPLTGIKYVRHVGIAEAGSTQLKLGTIETGNEWDTTFASMLAQNGSWLTVNISYITA